MDRANLSSIDISADNFLFELYLNYTLNDMNYKTDCRFYLIRWVRHSEAKLFMLSATLKHAHYCLVSFQISLSVIKFSKIYHLLENRTKRPAVKIKTEQLSKKGHESI